MPRGGTRGGVSRGLPARALKAVAPMRWTRLLCFISCAPVARGASHVGETTCADGGVPLDSAWIDVPTFWINVDTATERAAKMREQLARVLAPDTCATRVPAVTLTELGSVIRGSFLLDPNASGELRYASPTTRKLEIAVMLSHIKALFFASRLGKGDDAAFLILEDDVDLLYFPILRVKRPTWPTSRLSTDGMRRSFPADWSFAQLMVITLAKRWRLM